MRNAAGRRPAVYIVLDAGTVAAAAVACLVAWPGPTRTGDDVVRGNKVRRRSVAMVVKETFLGQHEVVEEMPFRCAEISIGVERGKHERRRVASDHCVMIDVTLRGGGIHAEPDVKRCTVNKTVVVDKYGADARHLKS